jgi:hypothetical protein
MSIRPRVSHLPHFTLRLRHVEQPLDLPATFTMSNVILVCGMRLHGRKHVRSVVAVDCRGLRLVQAEHAGATH